MQCLILLTRKTIQYRMIYPVVCQRVNYFFTVQLPSYKNFKGVIHELGQNQYLVSGEVSVLDKNTIEITELPVRTWTQVLYSLLAHFTSIHICRL